MSETPVTMFVGRAGVDEEPAWCETMEAAVARAERLARRGLVPECVFVLMGRSACRVVIAPIQGGYVRAEMWGRGEHGFVSMRGALDRPGIMRALLVMASQFAIEACAAMGGSDGK